METNKKKVIAQQFGCYLDADDFTRFKSLLEENCVYEIGGKVLDSKETIAGLYEKNMKEGKLKFDELVWGKSEVKQVNEQEFEVYFSDFLKHKGIEHNYKCKQRITINEVGLVTKIVHIELPGKREALKKFYKQVGLE